MLLAPVYLGFDGGKEGWWAETLREGNTAEVFLKFGRYLGTNFRDATNVVWLAGGDFAPPPGSEGERRHLAVLQGIRDAGALQPWAGHWNFQHQGGISTDDAHPGLQREMLESEGVRFEANGRIDLSRFGWDAATPSGRSYPRKK